MKHPAFYSLTRLLIYVSLFMLGGALVPLCLAGLTPLNLYILCIQGALSGLLVCGASIILWYMIRYTKISGLTPQQNVLNHLVLFFLTLLTLLGGEFLLFYLIFPAEIFRQLTFLIPFKLVMGILTFVIMIQFYGKKTGPGEAEISGATEPTEEERDILPEKNAGPEDLSKPIKRDLPDKITVRSGANINIIPVPDLQYLQAEGDYVILYTSGARFIKEETMKHMEEQLPCSFLRIHRSCIVNASYISRLELYEKQRYMITLKSGQKLKVSASGYKLLKEYLHLSS